jgi:tellurite methyltransferase
MIQDTVEKWNERYRNDLSRKEVKPREILTRNIHLIPQDALVLDVAMGAGGNGAFLQKLGRRVIGIDISDVAVRLCKLHSPEMMAVIGDMSSFSFPANTFDVILNFYFLQRELINRYARCLKPGGLVFMETLTRGMLAIKPDLTPDNLLEEGELLALFKGWNVIEYGEGVFPSSTGSQKAIARIVARNPGR